VTPFAAEFDLERLDVIRWAPVWMSRAERLLLYTLVFSLRPARYLEIGTLRGGSALVVNAALDALQSDGRIICVDPQPQIKPEHWQKLADRTTLIQGYSPDALPQAVEAAGGRFDLVLIDGDHSYKGVMRDSEGVLPYVTDGAYLLFHDSLFTDVARGLNDFAHKQAHQIVDFGSLTREVTYRQKEQQSPVRWGGLRLMQVRR
jgi:predicted O-methyltransferase YrrM